MNVTHRVLNPEDIPSDLPPGLVIAGHFVVESVEPSEDEYLVNLKWIANPRVTYEFVKSATRPNMRHVVVLTDGIPCACTCEDWCITIHRRQPYVCKHMTQAAMSMFGADTGT